MPIDNFFCSKQIETVETKAKLKALRKLVGPARRAVYLLIQAEIYRGEDVDRADEIWYKSEQLANHAAFKTGSIRAIWNV